MNLSNNNLGDHGLAILSQSLGQKNKTLISLNISSNNITHLGVSHLFKSLESNTHLIDLNLSSEVEGNSSNKLGPAGAEMLANLLTK